MADFKKTKVKPGAVVPWEDKLKELQEISGDKEIVKRIHENIDGLAYVYIWHCLLSF